MSRDYQTAVSEALNMGQGTMIPKVPGMTGVKASVGAVASPILCALEAKRLSYASLYYANPEMTTLAKLAGETPPIETLSLDRLPSESGFMVFAEPIVEFRDENAVDPEDRDVRIVAVSWSPWYTDDFQVTDDARVEWYAKTPDGTTKIPNTWEGIWLTFYVQVSGDSEVMPLAWYDEIVLSVGGKFSPDTQANSLQRAGQIVYTAWQLMSQTGTAQATDIETLPRDRAGRRRDQRDRIDGPGEVRVVRVHAVARQPSASAPEHGIGASRGEDSHRVVVPPYRRMHCMNPQAHATGDCTHKDQLILPHVRGPADAPLKLGQTVHLWDHQPPSG